MGFSQWIALTPVSAAAITIGVWSHVGYVEDVGWRETVDFEGSRYVGIISCILDGLPLTHMELN